MFLAIALLVIALATLWPMAGPSHTWAFCLVCGDHGAADFLLNVVLFMPLGAALARRGRPVAFITLWAALLSSAIEVSQLYIPGRDASIGDIVSNTTGAVCGALLMQSAHKWLFPERDSASSLSRAAAVGATLVCLATGLLLTPSFPKSLYFGLWTPNLGHLEWYRGRVLDATIDEMHIGSGPIAESDRVRDRLQSPGGYAMHVRALAGPRPSSLAPLFAVYDAGRREILLLGVDREDLVLRVHTRAADWRFDHPDLRLAALQHLQRGDTLNVRVSARRSRYSINGVERGFTVGDGWGLLLYLESLPFKNIVRAAWMLALFVPAGFWLRTQTDGMVALLSVLGSLLIVPAVTPLVATPIFQWVASGLGLLLGVYAARFMTPRETPPV